MALTPASSRSSLAAPATIAAPADGNPVLTLSHPAGASGDLLRALVGTDAAFRVLAFGGVEIAPRTASGEADPALAIFASFLPGEPDSDLIYVEDQPGNAVGLMKRQGYIYTAKGTAPADGELNPGELAFWFDPTNGAAKLMVKAKQADGTVRTAAVNLA